MEAMKHSGALTVAQDEDSCIVYGMPQEAVKRKAVRHVLAPEQIGQYLMEISYRIERSVGV
jgi:two-component system chemotaxis response regulator CheB